MSHTDRAQQTKQKRSPRRLRNILIALGVLVALPAAGLLALPAMLSSDFARGRVVQAVAAATGRETRLRSLDFSWSDGLRLEDLHIGRGSLGDPSFLCSLKKLHADADLLSLFRGRTAITLQITGLRLRARIPKTPPKPLPLTLRNLFAALRLGLAPTRLPIDVALRIDVSDGAAHLILPEGQEVELRRLFFLIDAPSVKTSPVSCRASLDPVLGGKALESARLTLRIAQLCNAAGDLDPARAQIAADLVAPGAQLHAGGDIATGLTAELRADLGVLAQSCAPLAPGLPRISGTLAAEAILARSGGPTDGSPTDGSPAAGPLRARAGLRVTLAGLQAAGGPLGRKEFGPFNVELRQTADLDATAETAALPGALRLAGQDAAAWRARLSGVRESRPRITAEVGPIALGLSQLLAATKGVVPPGVAIGSAELAAKAVDLDVLLPRTPQDAPRVTAGAHSLVLAVHNVTRAAPAGTLRIAEARIAVPEAKLRLPGPLALAARASVRNVRMSGGKAANDLAIAAAELNVHQIQAELPGARPGSVSLAAEAGVRGVRLGGKTPVGLDSATLTSLRLTAKKIAKNHAALFGVTGSASIEAVAKERGLRLADAADVPAASQRIGLRAELPAGRSATLRLDSFRLDAPRLTAAPADMPALTVEPVTLRASAGEIRLTRSGKNAALLPTLRDARLGLDLGGALRASARLDLSGPAGRDIASNGSLALDARRLLALAGGYVPEGMAAAGTLDANWKVSASLPRTAAATPPAEVKFSQRLRKLDFLHDAELVLALKNFNLDWPLPAKAGGKPGTLRLRDLNTPQPLRLSTRGGVAASSLSGSLNFGSLSGLPGMDASIRPVSGNLTFKAAQQGARSAQASESLRLNGRDLTQSLDLSLDKLDAVLDAADKPAAALEALDASLGFRLAGDLKKLPELTGGKAPAAGSGRLDAAADVHLSGGRSLALAARLVSPGLNLRLGPNVRLDGLTSDLDIRRTFAIAPQLACPGAVAEQTVPLSEQVFDQFPAARTPQETESSLAALLAPGAGQGLGRLGLRRAHVATGPLAFDASDVDVRLNAASVLPGLRVLKAGILGGSILCDANLRKISGRYVLESNLAFTGIDPGRLLPQGSPRDAGALAETSGRLRLAIPITSDPAAFLQNVVVRADITKIGPRTLASLLYALDPQEQNESIVQARKLVDMGYPRNLRLSVAYGNLSLSGAVTVKGFQLDLPPVDRLNIANLPIRNKLAGPLSAASDLARLLDAASGSVICRGQNGAWRAVQPAASQGTTP